MSRLEKIAYLTKAKYNELATNNQINDNYLYFITDETVSASDLGNDFILPVSKGGTGKTQFTSGSLLVGNGQNALTEIGATDQNTPNTIVKRNGSGNFSAGTITATLSGNATHIAAPAESGYTSDNYGNFKHKRTNTADSWNIYNNAGTAKFSVYWETGNVTAVGAITAASFSGSGASLTSLNASNISSGTLNLARLGNQNANLVLAGPGSGDAAAPTFRSLVTADIPDLSWNKITSDKPDYTTRWPKWNEITQSGAESITEGTSNVTDNTEILTSYASNNGFADTNSKGVVYRRDAIKLYNYIKGKLDSVYAAKATTLSGYGITDAKIASGVITLGSNTITPVTSVNGHTGDVTISDLGLASALKYVGAKSSLPTATEDTTYSTYNNGDVITVSNKEYAYIKGSNAAGSSWVELGDEGSYKLKQTAFTNSTGTADGSNTSTTFIYSFSQDENGTITNIKTRKLPTYNNYSHPTGDGNLHVPATGTGNNGKVLKAGSTAGSISWGTLTASDVGAAPSSTVSCTTANVKTALGTGSGTTKFLREDGTWQTPAYIANTDEKVKVAALTSGTTYYPILATAANTATRQADTTLKGLSYISTAGTASAIGTAVLALGNNTVKGTANNEQGVLRLYGTTAYYVDIKMEDGLPAANRTMYLPSYAGTMYMVAATTTDAVGSTTKPIYINNVGAIQEGTELKDLAYINKPTSDTTTTWLRGDGTWVAPPNDDTHHTAYLYAGANNATQHAAVTAGTNIYLCLRENSTQRSAVQIKQGTNMTISSDANGIITFASTDTNNAVTQNVSTTNKKYGILLSAYETSASTTTATSVNRDSKVYVNPSLNQIAAGQLTIHDKASTPVEKVTLQWNSTDSALEFVFG